MSKPQYAIFDEGEGQFISSFCSSMKELEDELNSDAIDRDFINDNLVNLTVAKVEWLKDCHINNSIKILQKSKKS